MRAVLSALPEPAFARNADQRLTFANPAYLQLAKALGKSGTESAP